MSGHEWHVLLAFAGLTIGLGIFEPKLALTVVGIAGAVVAVTNAGALTKLLP